MNRIIVNMMSNTFENTQKRQQKTGWNIAQINMRIS